VSLLEKKSPEDARVLAEQALVNDRGQVAGAMIQWIKGLDRDGFRSLGGKKKLLQLLGISKAPAGETGLAREASAMIAFDFVIGNWDRFSGGNVFLDPNAEGFVLIDNNGTFAPWSRRQDSRMTKMLNGVQRFGAQLTESLARLDAAAVERALAVEPWHGEHRLLSTEEIEILLKRRDIIMAHVDRLALVHGRDSVLAFR
jgi:hypothetical protein